MWEDVKEFINDIEPLLIVVIPTCFGIYLKLKNKLAEKEKQVNHELITKNKEKLLDWEHTESIKVINRIKNLCNYFKDIGHMDLVNYVQFENGTTATSRLCNMFLSCLAEDSRFSVIPKMISSFQRIPYGRMSTWINNIMNEETENTTFHSYIVKNKEEFEDDYSDTIIGSDKVKSFISSSVKDPNGMIIGICSFYYAENEWSGRSKEQCEELMMKFVSSIESIFIEYNVARVNKQKELYLYNDNEKGEKQ